MGHFASASRRGVILLQGYRDVPYLCGDHRLGRYPKSFRWQRILDWFRPTIVLLGLRSAPRFPTLSARSGGVYDICNYSTREGCDAFHACCVYFPMGSFVWIVVAPSPVKDHRLLYTVLELAPNLAVVGFAMGLGAFLLSYCPKLLAAIGMLLCNLVLIVWLVLILS